MLASSGFLPLGTSSALLPWRSAGWAGGLPSAGQLERARCNFAIVQSVVECLGGIPAMVSAEDFAEHGHDEKGCILFTAFLCHRLLEIRCLGETGSIPTGHCGEGRGGGRPIHSPCLLVCFCGCRGRSSNQPLPLQPKCCSKEERAAMVIQRHWRNRREDKPGKLLRAVCTCLPACPPVRSAACLPACWLLPCFDACAPHWSIFPVPMVMGCRLSTGAPLQVDCSSLGGAAGSACVAPAARPGAVC